MSLLAGPELRGESSSCEASLDLSSGSVLGERAQRLGQAHGFQIRCAAIGPTFAVTDAITIVFASLIGAGGYQRFISGLPWNLDFHVGAGATAAVLYFLIGRSTGFYHIGDIFSVRRSTTDIIRQWFLTSLLLALLAFLFRIGIEFSRGSIICFAMLALAMLLGSRSLMKAALALAVENGRVQGRRVVLMGLRDELAAVSQADLLRRFGLTEIARGEIPRSGGWSSATNGDFITSLDRVVALARERGAEEIVLAASWNETRLIELMRERLRSSPLPVQLLPDHKIRQLIGNPSFAISRSFAIEIQRAPLSRLERLTKRMLDIAGACLALLVLSPLMLLTALAIKLESRGPVLFRQQRSGFNAKRFTIFKFRTMTVTEDGDDVTQVTPNDPRVTKLGAILRASSIDELPQLFNVLFGNMSLVGPRPHALAHDGHYGKLLADYAFRHHVKPGITGWAQTHGYRGGTLQVGLMQKRLDFDLWYINNWNLGLDFMILLRTVMEVIRRRNAY